MLKLLVATFVGTVLEYYDLALYGYLAVAINKSLFPIDNPFWQTIVGLSIFALAYIVRPMGSILMGYLGDRRGRKYTLGLSMAWMAVATCCIGLIPSYNAIGYGAICLLLFFRCIQGFCMSGEYTGAMLLILESAPKKHHAFLGALTYSSSMMGFFLATFVIYLSYNYLDGSLQWRVPFLLGAFVSLIGFYIRSQLLESPVFEKIKTNGEVLKYPLMEAMRQNFSGIMVTAGIAVCDGAFFFFLVGFFPIYFEHILDLPESFANHLQMMAVALVMILLPLSGSLADRIGPFRFMKWGGIFNLLVCIPIFLLFKTKDPSNVFLGICLFSLCCVFYNSCISALLVQLFPPAQRYSGIAFSYTTSIALFGATSPLIARFIIRATNLDYAPGFYLAFVSVLGLVAAIYGKRIALQKVA